MTCIKRIIDRETFINTFQRDAQGARLPEQVIDKIYDCVVSCPSKLHRHACFNKKLLALHIQKNTHKITAHIVFPSDIAQGLRKTISSTVTCRLLLKEKTICLSKTIFASSHAGEFQAYLDTQRCLARHHELAKLCPDVVAEPPQWSQDLNGRVIEYIQCFYPKTWEHYKSKPLFIQTKIAVTICYALGQLHSFGYTHGDLFTNNVFVKKIVNEDGSSSYTSCLNDFDLSESFYAPVEWPIDDDLLRSHTLLEAHIISSLITTPAEDTLQITLLLHNLCYYNKDGSYGRLTSFEVFRTSRKASLDAVHDMVRSRLPDYATLFNSPPEVIRQALLRVRIGDICKKVISGIKRLQSLAVINQNFYELLTTKQRNEHQVSLLLGYVYRHLPKMSELQDAYASLSDSKILLGEELVTHLKMEHFDHRQYPRGLFDYNFNHY